MKQVSEIGLNFRTAILFFVLGILLGTAFPFASAQGETASTAASTDNTVNDSEAMIVLDKALSVAKDEEEKTMIMKGFLLMRPGIEQQLSPVSLSSFTSTGVQAALQQEEIPEKCGTPYIIKLYEISNRLDPVSKQDLKIIISAIPPGLNLNLTVEKPHFIVYYNDSATLGNSATPAANATKIADYLEKAYDTEITSWGLPRPVSHAPANSKYHVYVYRLNAGTFGVTFNMSNGAQRATEIAITNNIASDDLLLASEAHEYFHAIQHAYISIGAGDNFAGNVRIWVSEGSTSWVEGEVRNQYPAVNGTADWDLLKARTNEFMLYPWAGFWSNYNGFIFYYYLADNSIVNYKAGRQNYEVVKDVWAELGRRNNWDQWEAAFTYAARNAPDKYNDYGESHRGFAKANLFKNTWYPKGNEFASVSRNSSFDVMNRDDSGPEAHVIWPNGVVYFNITGPDVLKYEVEIQRMNAATRLYSKFFEEGNEAKESELLVTGTVKKVVDSKVLFLVGRVAEEGGNDISVKVTKLKGNHNSTDKDGQKTVKFYTGEKVFVAGKNFTPDLPVNIYVTKHFVWGNDTDIERQRKDTVPVKAITTDPNGVIANTQLWEVRKMQEGGKQDEGEYDIIVDNDKNGKYNSSIDALFQNFKVDLGVIQIQITGVSDGWVYEQGVNAKVTVLSQANLKNVKITWGSEDSFNQPYTDADNKTKEEQSHTFLQRDSDITHTLSVTGEDQKGNKETQQVTFKMTKKKNNNDKPDDSYDVANGFLQDKNILDDYVRLAMKKGGRDGVLWYKDMKTKADAYAALPPDASQELRNATWQDFFNATFLVERNEAKLRQDFQNTPEVAILSQGFADSMKALLADYHIPSVLLTTYLSNVSAYPVLIIPTGGLDGFDSPLLRAKLSDYVNNGGVLVAFTQQRGYDFKALPGGEVNGVGWFEDQSCQYASVFVNNYHQVLASQTSATPSINVDGYFTAYPSNSTIILSRTKNSMPAMILYEYGKGIVIATTNYDDWAYANYASSTDGRNLIRDTVSWAKSAKQLPEYERTEPVSLLVNITNNGGKASSNISFAALNPGGSLAGYVNLTAVIVPGETKGVYFNYSLSKPYGLWWVDYKLLNGNEIMQRGYDVASFAVSMYKETPGGFAYHASNISYGVSSDSENYANGGNGTFTITVWNRGNESKNITVWWSFPHNYWTKAKPIYGAPGTTSPGHVSNLNRTLLVPGEGSASFQYTVPLFSYDRLWADFYDGYESSLNFLGKATRGFYTFEPSVEVKAETKEDTYLAGDNATLYLSLRNRQGIAVNVTASIRIIDPENGKIFEKILNASLPAYGYSNSTIESSPLIAAKKGSYSVIAEVSGNEAVIGYSSTYFSVIGASLKLSKTLPDRISAGSSATFIYNISNTGKTNISGGALKVSLLDPNGYESWNGTKPFDLLSGTSINASFNIPFGEIKFGDYRLRHSLEFESDRISGESLLSNIVSTQLSTDKASYRVREPLDFTANITNSGLFVQNLKLETTSPDLAFSRIETFVMNPGETKSFSYNATIPGSIDHGSHNITVNASLGASSDIRNFFFFIPGSQLLAQFEDKTQYNPDDAFNTRISNTGGVDTTAIVRLSIKKDFLEVYTNSSNFTVKAGDSVPLTFLIPGQWVSGDYLANLDAENASSGVKGQGYKSFSINGINAAINTRTSKDVFFKTENITILTDLLNQIYPIVNGTLNLKIIEMSQNRTITTQGSVTAKVETILETENNPRGGVNEGLDKVNPKREQSMGVMSYGNPDAKYRILVLSGGKTNDNDRVAYDFGSRMPDYYFETYYANSQTPSQDYLGTFDAILLYEDGVFDNANNIGNATYQYVINGGNLLIGTFYDQERSDNTYYRRAGWGLLELIDPFTTDTRGCKYSYDSMNISTIVDHPIMEEVSSIYSNSYRGGARAKPGTTVLAFWTTPNILGEPDPLVGFRVLDIGQRVVQISIFPASGNASFNDAGGDFFKLWTNAIEWASAGEKTVWETNMTVNLSANEAKELTTITPVLNITGNYRLKATLTNNIGQKIGTGKYLFNIIDTNMTVLLSTDKEAYRPNETININGMVYNFADAPAQNASIKVRAGSIEVFNQTVNIPAKGNYGFTATHRATGSFTLLGNLMVGSGNSSFAGKVTVAAPRVSASIKAPDIVGSEPFGVDLLLSNNGPTDANLVIKTQGDMKALFIPAGGSKAIHYTASTREDFNYNIEIGGDATIFLSKYIKYGINMGAEVPDILNEGAKSIPVTLTNTGMLDVNSSMDFKLYKAETYPAEMVYSATMPFFLPGGNSKATIFLAYAPQQMDYILECNSSVLQVTKAIHIAKENDLAAELGMLDDGSGLIKAIVNVSNLGVNDFVGSAELGSSFYSETKDLNLSAGHNTSLEFNVSTKYAIPGTYNFTFQALVDGNVILEKNTTLTLYAPAFEITEISKDSNYTIGSRGSLRFRVRNNGSSVGEANLNLDISGIYAAANSSTIKPGDEALINYSFLIPDDLEEKNYRVVYDLNSVKNETSIFISGIKIDVNASLDKRLYKEGEVAHLNLTVSNRGTMNLSMYARVKFNDFDSSVDFGLKPFETNDSITFTVPVNFTGNKVFYGIYTSTGRSIYINSAYIYKENDPSSGIQLYMDKQVYSAGETAIIHVNTTNLSRLEINARNLSINENLTGEKNFSYLIPNGMSGTYYLDYTFGNYSGLYPFDVIGYSGRVIEARLDNASFESGSTVNLTIIAEINQNANGTLKLWIYDPTDGIVAEKEVNITLEKGENRISEYMEFWTSITGIHRIAYELDIDIAGNSLVPLAFGSEYFDGIAAPAPTPTPTPQPSATIPSGGSSGGTGGGGVTTMEPFDNIEIYEMIDGYLRSDQPVTYRFQTPEHWINELVINGTENEYNIAIRIESLKGMSKLVTSPAPGTKYINIWAGTKKIRDALIRFRVPNSWLASEGLTSGDVRMYRWDESRWVMLETRELNGDSTNSFYEARTNAFSQFAISGLKEAAPTAAPEVTATTKLGITPTAHAVELPLGKIAGMNWTPIAGVFVLIIIVVLLYLRKNRTK